MNKAMLVIGQESNQVKKEARRGEMAMQASMNGWNTETPQA